jgi:hypothetical protein
MTRPTDITRATGREIPGTYRMNDGCTRKTKDNTIGTFEPHQAGIHNPDSAGAEARNPRPTPQQERLGPLASLDDDGQPFTNDEGLCMCSACRKRREEATQDEAIESSSTEISTPAAVNDANRKRHNQPALQRS